MTTINISLEFNGQQMDYQIPKEVTMGRLTELMNEALKGLRLPQSWTLALKDKDIKIDETDLIKDLPIGDGDVFCIVPLPIERIEKEKQEPVDESI